ncbi:bifunctional lysylphosphatidylglycerol flippase/synthetase MprF [Rhodococcus erythropolis]|uniref:bifunctional lysylphosphatidylglycerol flippase/synthetase MprF n=1 Tax=Rhodococcus erythropolis TaxID=1833 RepID=UPI0002E7B7C0|nr:phosphatidylglycerol lysyltransferase domain-containing protein [Rhodococcus erythropolis]
MTIDSSPGTEESTSRARVVTQKAAGIIRFGIRDAPLTVVLLLTMWILGAVTGSIVHGPSRDLEHTIGAGMGSIQHGHVWIPLSSALWAGNLLGYIGASVLLIAVAAPLERRMGTIKLAIAGASTQILGVLLGLGWASFVKVFDSNWGFRLHVGSAVGASAWIVGAAMAASSNMGTLWRRRIRVGTLALTITLALFSGQLQDVIRFFAAVVGLVIGQWIVGRSARGERIAGTQREGRVLVAIVVAASAIGPMIAALSPQAVGPLAVLRDLFRGVPWTVAEVRELCAESASDPDCRRGLLELRLSGIGPTLLSLMPSIFVLVLSDGLRRGRRFAWIATVCAQVVLLVLSIGNFVIRFVDAVDSDSLFYGISDPNVYRTLVPFLTPLFVLILLIATRRYFDVAAPAKTYRRLGAAIVTLLAVLAVIYVGGGMLARHGFDREPTVTLLLADFPQRLVPPVYLQLIDPRLLPVDIESTLLFEWTGVVFWSVAAVLVFVSFLKPVKTADPKAAERARSMLIAGTGSPLSWMTTWKGNTYWFSADGSSYVAYRVIAGVALTTGDPVGPPDRMRAAIEGFAEFASSNGWIPCFYSVTDDARTITDSMGWSGLQVAEETVLDLGQVAFTGKRFQDVRTALNRAKKSGITAEWISFPHAPLAIKDQIVAISEEWVADKGMPEMGFTLGGLDEVDDEQVRCLIAVDEDRTVHGVTSWLPVYRDGKVVGWTLDFMRRRSEGFRPAMEFLIASAALKLEEEGVEFLSLSGAPLATIAGDSARNANEPEATTFSAMMDSVLDLLGRTLEPVYGFRSLLAFKSKFQPRYVPMHMTFADPAALPSIGNAVGRAYLPTVTIGQGFKLVRTILGR